MFRSAACLSEDPDSALLICPVRRVFLVEKEKFAFEESVERDGRRELEMRAERALSLIDENIRL